MTTTIKPTPGRKRGRVLRTDTGREISHEEIVYGLIKRTAVELTESKQCVCGSPIERRRGRKESLKCLACRAIEKRTRCSSGYNAEKPRSRRTYSVQENIAQAMRDAASSRKWRQNDSKRLIDSGTCRYCRKSPSETASTSCRACKDSRNKSRVEKRREAVKGS